MTASNAGGSASATSAKTATVAADPPPPPANTAPPTITGTATQGNTLTATTGTWTNSPTSYTYHWQDCTSSGCTNISGATSSSYTLQASDVSDTIDVVVTASNAGGSSSAASAKTATVAADSTAPAGQHGAPDDHRNRYPGQTLTATTGSWTNSPTSYAYQWLTCTNNTSLASCSNATGSGATSTIYTIASADVGDYLRAQVTATNAGGSTSQPSGDVRSSGWGRQPAHRFLDVDDLDWVWRGRELLWFRYVPVAEPPGGRKRWGYLPRTHVELVLQR